MIVTDERNPKAKAIRAALLAALPQDFEFPAGVRVVIGGDGFMLRTAHEGGREPVYLGLNAGHLGFLLNDPEDMAAVASSLEEGRYEAVEFSLLEAKIETADGEKHQRYAINDLYLERSSGQASRLNLRIDDFVVVDGLVADGLVFATALGSTAYSYSAGGPPIHPSLKLLQVTPICPHLPRLSPFTLPPSSRASVEVVHPQWRPVRAVADGVAVEDAVSVEVGLSDEVVRFAYLESHNLTRQMLRKIVHQG